MQKQLINETPELAAARAALKEAEEKYGAAQRHLSGGEEGFFRSCSPQTPREDLRWAVSALYDLYECEVKAEVVLRKAEWRLDRLLGVENAD